MVPSQAPGAKRLEMGRAGESWISSFLEAHAQRTRRGNLFTALLVVCTVVPVGLWSRTEAVSEASAPGQSDTVVPLQPNILHKDAEGNATFLSKSSHPATESLQQSTTPDTASAHSAIVAPVTAPSAPVPQADSGPLVDLRVVVSGQVLQGKAPQNSANVGAAVKAMGVEINQLDRLEPGNTAAFKPGMTVRITRVRTELRKRQESIAPEKRFKPTDELGAGDEQTVQHGKPGVIEVTERIWFVDGEVTQREMVSRNLVRPAQDTIVALGSRSRYMPNEIPYHNRYARGYAIASRGGSPRDRLQRAAPGTLRALKCIDLVATGYSPDPRENGGYTRTCTGLPIGYGAAAVDPRVVPLGSKLYVEGYGYAFACDTGGAIKGHRIDLAYDSYHVANMQGRKHVKVWILGR